LNLLRFESSLLPNLTKKGNDSAWIEWLLFSV